MCNDYGIDIPFSLFVEAFETLGAPLDVSGGIPNLQPRDEIWPTERAPVILSGAAGPRLDMLTWGLPPSRPKAPVVINMRSEGRRFERGRCLIPASHFYEFTGAKSPKTRWRFTKTGEDWFCIAGITVRRRLRLFDADRPAGPRRRADPQPAGRGAGAARLARLAGGRGGGGALLTPRGGNVRGGRSAAGQAR